MIYSHKRGFTLIELLVVIAIIGLLSTIVLAAINKAKTKANNAAINSEVHQLVIALEEYRSSNPSGTYPMPSSIIVYWVGQLTGEAPFMPGFNHVTSDSQFLNAINPYFNASSQMILSTPTVSYGGGSYHQGIVYERAFDPITNRWEASIAWLLSNDTSYCSMNASSAYPGGIIYGWATDGINTACEIDLYE